MMEFFVGTSLVELSTEIPEKILQFLVPMS